MQFIYSDNVSVDTESPNLFDLLKKGFKLIAHDLKNLISINNHSRKACPHYLRGSY